jgi:hypothetical protein
MGVIYCVFPLDEKMADWLDREGVSHPAVKAWHRDPKPIEVLEAIRHLPGYKVEITVSGERREWSAQIYLSDGSWATVRISDFRSDEAPHSISFIKGWPEIMLNIVERLTKHCGPLVIVDDSSGSPLLVLPNSEVKELIRFYTEPA